MGVSKTTYLATEKQKAKRKKSKKTSRRSKMAGLT